MAVDLHATTDARVWAAEFVRLNPAADEGLMLAWFANAIEAGRSAGLADGEHTPTDADDPDPDAVSPAPGHSPNGLSPTPGDDNAAQPDDGAESLADLLDLGGEA